MSNHGCIRLKTMLLNVHVKSWLNTLKDKACKIYMSNHGGIRLKTRLLNVHVKSCLHTLKDNVATCTYQIMVEYA